MKKGDSTRSGMLWEVERILDECKELNTLPNILFMENVPEVIGKKNIKDFQEWVVKLESLGYSNYVECLNSKDYGVPQNRNRCFMISILGEYSYKFPLPFKLELRLKDILEPHVDEKYYLSEKMISCLTNEDTKGFNRDERFIQTLINTNFKGIASTVETRAGTRPTSNFIINTANKDIVLKTKNKRLLKLINDNTFNENDTLWLDTYNQQIKEIAGTITTGVSFRNETFVAVNEDVYEKYEGMYQYSKSDCFMKNKDRFTKDKELADTLQTNPKEGVVVKQSNELIKYGSYYTWKDKKGNYNTQCNRAANENECALTIACAETGKVLENNLRIRKLTPRECFRLMGVKDEDFDKIKINQTDTSLYHLAGDSIVVDVMKHIFKNLL